MATAIPDDLLAEIFLRLPDLADLARVSATCPLFRRVATHRCFLGRYRKLHPRPFLGFVDEDTGFHPALEPHPAAPAARALARAADFSFSFLLTPAIGWAIQDVRDGRVLLLDCNPCEDYERRVMANVAVCDPLYRQYRLLPSVPIHLAAAEPPMRWCEPFFVPRREDEEEDDALAFRVMWMAEFQTKLAVFDFSSTTGQWRAASSTSLGDLLPAAVKSQVQQPGEGRMLLCRRYVYGCFYWVTTYWWEKMLQLDTVNMVFSVTDFPPGGWRSRSTVIVEAGEGRHEMFFLEHSDGHEDTSHLQYTTRPNNGNQWQMEKPIAIPFGYRYDFVGKTEKHLVLQMTTQKYPRRHFEYFSLDVKTLNMEKVCDSKYPLRSPHRYTNFPPSLLSSPTVCNVPSGMQKGAAEELLEEGCQHRHP